jgi:NAD dependent epimerase/dehydratase family enzyme
VRPRRHYTVNDALDDWLSTGLDGPAAAQVVPRPRVWVQMSTLAIYGDAGEMVLDESAPPADGPAQMAGVARAWEQAAAGVAAERQVIVRAGVVLERDIPALDRLCALTRWGLGGRIGDGRQWVSWLHAADFTAVVQRLIDDSAFPESCTRPAPARYPTTS